MPANTAVQRSDGRIHSTVFHKRDRRVNDIVRRCRKSEIISLYGIDCHMLFRVEQAHVQFDMMQNYRPYIQFDGHAEGVFLQEKTGLLFPNACDQLDFRTDFPVTASMSYALSDLEIATLANNGLFNNGWSCQGRVIGSLLEIPCKVDYSAIANTPITFVEIQDRLSLHTSTMKTGYKTLAAAFLPFKAQKHNEEQSAKLRDGVKFDRETSDIRRRALYDAPTNRFSDDFDGRTMADGASFVEVAQSRIQQRLRDQMAKANMFGTPSAGETAKAVADAVTNIKEQTDKARKKEVQQTEDAGHKVEQATLDARLNDMASRMTYAGAEVSPVDRPKVDAKSLAEPKAPGRNDDVMTSPTTDVARKPGADRMDDPVSVIDDLSDRIHSAAHDAENAAAATVAAVNDVKRTLSRKDRLAQRRAEQQARLRQQQDAMTSAGKEEAGKGLEQRDADVEVKVENKVTGKTEVRVQEKKSLDGDIISTDVDIDALARDMGLT